MRHASAGGEKQQGHRAAPLAEESPAICTDTVTRVAIDTRLDHVPGVLRLVATQPDGLSIAWLSSERVTDPDIVLIPADGEDKILDHWRTARERTNRPRIIIVGRPSDHAFRERAILQGAAGVLDPSTSPELLQKALTCVARGELWLDRRTTGCLFERLSRGVIPK